MSALSIFRKGGLYFSAGERDNSAANRSSRTGASLPDNQKFPQSPQPDNPSDSVFYTPESSKTGDLSTISTDFSTAYGDKYRSVPTLLPAAEETVYMKLPDALPLCPTLKHNSDNSDIGRIQSIDIELIVPNPSQPRKNFDDEAIIRLADSIRRYGILQPISVRHSVKTETETGTNYVLIAGERRLRAARLLGLSNVPCIIIDVDERTSAELAIIENIQRENLNIFEQAGAIASLIDIYSLTQEQIARQLSTSQSYIANKLRILRLTSRERELILSNNLTERHARALLKIEDIDKRIQVIEHIIAKGLNVAAAEDYIERFLCAPIISPDALKNRRKLVLKDIRIFYNTIDKALTTIKEAGITVQSDRTERDDIIELVIKIPKQYEHASPIVRR